MKMVVRALGPALSSCVFVLFMASARSSHAGEGRFTAEDGGPARVSMTVHLAFPPTQAKLAEIVDKFERASRMFCDATDGALRIDELRFERSGLSASQADVIWLPPKTVSRTIVSGRLPYGHDGKRLRTQDGISFATLAHEFGHLVVGLRDQYDEQRRFGQGCGIGVAIEAEDWSEQHHSIMQRYRPRCGTEDGDAIVYDELGPTYCYFDADCRPGYRCYEQSDSASELGTPLVFERVRGDGLGFEGPRPGVALHLDLLLGEDVPARTWQAATRTLDWVDPAGDSHAVRFEGYREDAHGRWRLRAFLGEHVLTWQVRSASGEGPRLTELPLAFGATADCGNSLGDLAPATIADDYFLARIGDTEVDAEGLALTLWLPAAAIGADEDWPIEVVTTDLCESRGALGSYPHVWVRPNDVDDQPDGIGHGAYFGAYGDGAPRTEPVYQQLGRCEAEDVAARWNRTTQRFEASSQWVYVARLIAERGFGPGDPEYRILEGSPEQVGGSDWELMEYTLKYAWPALVPSFAPVDVGWASPVDHDDKLASSAPVADNRAECGYPIAVDTRRIEAPDAVAIVLDRSGSMGHRWQIGSDEQTRMRWAQKGVAGFVAAADGEGMQIAVLAFDLEHEQIVAPSLIDSTAAPGTPGVLRPAELVARVDAIEPRGRTAIHDAVAAAFALLPAASNPAVLLFTDGEDNGSALSLADLNEQARALDVPVFVAPIGDFSGTTLDTLASASGGELFARLPPDQIPAAFFQLRARLRGEQLALIEGSRLSHHDLRLPGAAAHAIEVEPGAARLVVLLTPEAASKPTWAVDLRLRGPAGELLEADDPRVQRDVDGYFTLITVPSPSPGTWTLELAAPRSETPKPVPEAQLVLAHVEHAGPQCLASVVVERVTDPSRPAQIVAEASWGERIGEGVTFEADVRRPDGTWVPVAMTPDEDGLGWGSFGDYGIDGSYLVRVRCRVAPTARFAHGELHPDQGLTDPAQFPGGESRPGQEFGDGSGEPAPAGFTRVATTAFVLARATPATSTWAGLDPDGDCDGDGLSNARELPPGRAAHDDHDGDGWPDLCDADADGDDRTDLDEGLGDLDGDGLANRYDRDSDDDGELDGVDDDPADPDSAHRFARGDFDGDGLLDLAWGEPEADEARGQVWVRTRGRPRPAQRWRQGGALFDAPEPGDRFGASVAAGDFDGDGFDDLAIGVPGEGDPPRRELGLVHVLYGSPTGLTGAGEQVWAADSDGLAAAAQREARFGERLATGDLDCDGFADLIVGVPAHDRVGLADAGAIQILHGDPGGLTAVADRQLEGVEAHARFGDALAVGDFDGDGCDDLAVASPGRDVDRVIDAGEVEIWAGAAAGLDPDSAASVWPLLREPIVAGARFGARLWARDADHDGHAELVVMAPGHGCGPGTKRFYRLVGGPAGLTAEDPAWRCRESDGD